MIIVSCILMLSVCTAAAAVYCSPEQRSRRRNNKFTKECPTFTLPKTSAKEDSVTPSDTLSAGSNGEKRALPASSQAELQQETSVKKQRSRNPFKRFRKRRSTETGPCFSADGTTCQHQGTTLFLSPNSQCAMCLEDLAQGPAVTLMALGCGHVYHKTCITEHLVRKGGKNKTCMWCPVCKADLVELAKRKADEKAALKPPSRKRLLAKFLRRAVPSKLHKSMSAAASTAAQVMLDISQHGPSSRSTADTAECTPECSTQYYVRRVAPRA